ncbi:Diphthamide methyltransferase [Carabus blaptoides fortunei]
MRSGLGDCKDVTMKGFEVIKKCDRVYLEAYTSILTVGVEELEEYYGRKLIIADRDLVEQGADDILEGSQNCDVALLVVGDPFGATTHTDLVLRAKEKGIQYQVVHNASIMNAIGCTGLQLYSFGETVSIPFWTDTWKPDSFMDKIVANFERNLHTLCLLDIRVKEPTLESIVKKKKEYEPPRFMSCSVAAQQIIQIIKNKFDAGESSVLVEENRCVGVARVGSSTQQIKVCSLKDMQTLDLGTPLHSLVIPARELHPLEDDYLRQFVVSHN